MFTLRVQCLLEGFRAYLLKGSGFTIQDSGFPFREGSGFTLKVYFYSSRFTF